ncbi:MAG: anthranilate synthase component I [Nitrospinota bacterium]
MYSLTKEEFINLSNDYNLIPIYKEIIADLETPVSAFAKIDGDGSYSFLLESVTGGDTWGRYTILGSNPSLIYKYKNNIVTIVENGVTKTHRTSADPLDELKVIMSTRKLAKIDGLPRFIGGAVGFLAYDAIRYFEELDDDLDDNLDTPDALYIITDSIIIFDNFTNKIKIVNCQFTESKTPSDAYDEAIEKIEQLLSKLSSPIITEPIKPKNYIKPDHEFLTSKENFLANVERAKEYIRAGDIFQVVLSQRAKINISSSPFTIYRALRLINPSPYMYYLNFGNLQIVGASPETLVRLEGRQITARPIAGTRARGRNDVEDQHLTTELLADEKEAAEHVMLVDLGRNDVGRVAKAGSVEVNKFRFVEYYSHVMHIVSNIQGTIHDKFDAFDLLKVCFPVGTLTGAPKIRAMEIIDELETFRRGLYGGTVGYFSFSGGLDSAVAIRTLQIKDGVAMLQAGAGIVADSIPANELQESVNKANALMKAIELAENQLIFS